MSAGNNEKFFLHTLEKQFGVGVLGGKRNFNNHQQGSDKVTISVDQSIELPNGKTLLIEIDSANMAKLLVGQYVLLNGLISSEKENQVFLVVHYYKDYNPQRTEKNLHEIRRLYNSSNWLKYCAIHKNELDELVSICNTVDDFVAVIWDRAF
ncbi:hypothetical protein BA893_06955 [Vibrio natriegens]|uniref:hypothetical protein n=1 Tax=Vibrio natriegens TaxID=691 RepID=UPI0008042371|nr:hypothetical protein [Vibrio natriegens]ANQ21419.1 hypothetical protein BA893_06955 [Vibrio natriegens]